jgi:hypothetical protein
MALIDRVISNALPHQMGADGEALQIVLVENVPTGLNIAIIGEGFVHFKVVAPAS